jgi:hypothetical protein
VRNGEANVIARRDRRSGKPDTLPRVQGAIARRLVAVFDQRIAR